MEFEKKWRAFSEVQGKTLQQAARIYADYKFKVHACSPMGKGSVFYEEGGAPVSINSLLRTDSEPWKMHEPGFNVALGTGDDFWVLDIDGERGEKSLCWLQERLQTVFHTFTVKTGNGWHLYFKMTGGPIPTAVSVLPGIDVRGLDGIVVAPPSIHYTGLRYDADLDRKSYDPLPAEPPPELLKLVQNAEHLVLRPQLAALDPDIEKAARMAKGSQPTKSVKSVSASPLPALDFI